ncbi:MAG: hypothetical protein H0U95_03480 [Bacteroidetes bacterium]|nr:hypothetical protein [Bacteroidota bacterium]
MPLSPHFPFQLFCKQLTDIFKKAKTNSNPAMFLYKNKARMQLFMAESILRVSNKLFEDKEIIEWHATIKKLEDYLGEIDHYLVLSADFSKLKTVQMPQLKYISDKLEKAVDKLNKKLIKHDFYLADLKKMNEGFKINFNDKKLILKLQEEIRSELKESCDFFDQYPKAFTDMEEQVHELRRKLRWISIYGESFQGLIVLKETKEKYPWEKEFITKNEVINPFNKLPVKKNLVSHITFNKKAFYALSYVIENIGKIKDKGLSLEALEKSVRKTSHEKNGESVKVATKQLNANYTHDSLLKEAHALLKSYFKKYKLHEALA